MTIDYKVTVWQRIDVPDGADLDKLKTLVKKGNHTEINDYLMEVNEPAGDFPRWEYLEDTEEQMQPKDNEGEATIELMIDGEVRASNVVKN